MMGPTKDQHELKEDSHWAVKDYLTAYRKLFPGKSVPKIRVMYGFIYVGKKGPLKLKKFKRMAYNLKKQAEKQEE